MSKKITFYISEDGDATFNINAFADEDSKDDCIQLCKTVLNKFGVDCSMEDMSESDVIAKVVVTVDSVTYGTKGVTFKKLSPEKSTEKPND